MHCVDRFICSLFLAAAIVAPALVVAEAKAQEAAVQVRVYDRDHHDYHNWDDREDRAYRRYLVEQPRSYREYNRQHHGVAAAILELAPQSSGSRLTKNCKKHKLVDRQRAL